jgi:HD-GYP domain-containing protein (c-di-GMP phosphodiesterase class II)
MATETAHLDVDARLQQSGKQILTYVFSLMKTGEIHDLNNDAWIRPVEKLLDSLDELLKIERQAINFVVYEGVAQVNSTALWLDASMAEQAEELEGWLARREAGGLIFTTKPQDEELRRFFYEFARYQAPQDAPSQLVAFQNAMIDKRVRRLKLAPQPVRLDSVGVGVRGVSSLWVYGKATAGMDAILQMVPVRVRSARRLAQEIVDASERELDFLIGLTQLGTARPTPGRAAVDRAILACAVGRAVGFEPTDVAELTLTGLLHGAGRAYRNPDPKIFTIGETTATLAIRGILEADHVSPELARRISTAISHGLGASGKGPPYVAGAPSLIVDAQIVAIAGAWLERVRGSTERAATSPLEAMSSLLRARPQEVDAEVLRVFAGAIGLLPVGTPVELQNGDRAVVGEVDHLRGRGGSAPVANKRKVFVYRMFDAAGHEVPERKARVQLGVDDEEGRRWTVRRTLDPGKCRDMVVRAIIQKPTTLIAQLGIH